MRRRAFTLTEVSIAILILGITAAFMTLSTNTAKQTAENEAKRLAAKINRLIERTDRTHSALWVNVTDDGIEIRLSETYSETSDPAEKFNATKGCNYSGYNASKNFAYNIPILNQTKQADSHGETYEYFTMNNATVDVNAEPKGKYNIQVKDSRSSLYYVLINGN